MEKGQAIAEVPVRSNYCSNGKKNKPKINQTKKSKKKKEKSWKVGKVIIKSEDDVMLSTHVRFRCLISAIFSFDPFSTCQPNVLHKTRQSCV